MAIGMRRMKSGVVGGTEIEIEASCRQVLISRCSVDPAVIEVDVAVRGCVLSLRLHWVKSLLHETRIG